MVDWEPSYPGIERLARASNPGVGAVDKRSVRGTAGEDSVAQVGMPWGRLRGKLDSTRSEEPGRIHFAWGELAVAGLSASVGVAHGMTWCELDLEKTGGSPMSSFENVPGVALRQKSLRRQHLAGRKRGVRKAGSSGLVVLLNPPSSYDICESVLCWWKPKKGQANDKISQQTDDQERRCPEAKKRVSKPVVENV